jgi:hypothetical protein
MASQNYARFMYPADEPSYEGVTAENIEIDEVMIDGHSFPVGLLADFAWDETGWDVERLFLKTYQRIYGKDANGNPCTVFVDHFIPITDKPEWKGFVDAAAAWANDGLDVGEFA